MIPEATDADEMPTPPLIGGTFDPAKVREAHGKRDIREVTKLANVSETAYRAIESGGMIDPPLSQALRIAAALGSPVEKLVHTQTLARHG